jgi:alpha-galactosidase
MRQVWRKRFGGGIGSRVVSMRLLAQGRRVRDSGKGSGGSATRRAGLQSRPDFATVESPVFEPPLFQPWFHLFAEIRCMLATRFRSPLSADSSFVSRADTGLATPRPVAQRWWARRRTAMACVFVVAGWVGCLGLASGHGQAVAAEPVKVYILAGQSNMEGTGFIAADPSRNGGKGSLEFVAKDPATAPRFRHLLDANGKWIVRDDVSITYLDRKGALTVGYGARPDRIGPELGFGVVVGDASEAPVLLVKCAWGGKSLAVDFRPPSAGPVPYSQGEKTDEAIKQDPQIVGKYYRETLSLAKAALANVGALVPGSEGRGHVLAGFGWHQGWNDRINDKHNAAYEENMAHFIRDMRRDLNAPKLPFVIAETGMNGPTETHPRALSLMKAQAAVAARPEFQGNVAFVPTRSFWRPQDQSPTGQGYHWNTNAETYYLIGDAMGRAMLDLSSAGKKP